MPSSQSAPSGTDRFEHPYFTAKGTEAQRKKATSLGSQGLSDADLGLQTSVGTPYATLSSTTPGPSVVPQCGFNSQSVTCFDSASGAFRYYPASSADWLSNDIIQCLMCLHAF